MINVAPCYDGENHRSLFGQARVLSVDPEKRTAKIYLEHLSGIQEIEAFIATSLECEILSGDMVLIAGESIDAIYVIGTLTPRLTARIHARNDSYVECVKTAEESLFRIFSEHGDLVVEYDADRGKTRINCADGDLEILAPSGNIALNSSESIELSGQAINLTGKKRINASVREHPGDTASFSMCGSHAKLSVPDLQVSAKRGNVFVKDLVVAGTKVLANLLQATLKSEKLETRTRSVISRTGSLFQYVEGLTQLKTGRLKTLIRKSYHLKSNNTVFKSDEDCKIKAKKIHLG